MSERYASKIEVNDGFLRVHLSYERRVTRQEVEQSRDYFRRRFVEQGHTVVPESIEVHPGEGELADEATIVRVAVGDPFPRLLREIHRRAPYVLPRFVDDLARYKESNTLTGANAQVVTEVLDGLAKLVQGSESVV